MTRVKAERGSHTDASSKLSMSRTWDTSKRRADTLRENRRFPSRPEGPLMDGCGRLCVRQAEACSGGDPWVVGAERASVTDVHWALDDSFDCVLPPKVHSEGSLEAGTCRYERSFRTKQNKTFSHKCQERGQCVPREIAERPLPPDGFPLSGLCTRCSLVLKDKAPQDVATTSWGSSACLHQSPNGLPAPLYRRLSGGFWGANVIAHVSAVSAAPPL